MDSYVDIRFLNTDISTLMKSKEKSNYILLAYACASYAVVVESFPTCVYSKSSYTNMFRSTLYGEINHSLEEYQNTNVSEKSHIHINTHNRRKGFNS